MNSGCMCMQWERTIISESSNATILLNYTEIEKDKEACSSCKIYKEFPKREYNCTHKTSSSDIACKTADKQLYTEI